MSNSFILDEDDNLLLLTNNDDVITLPFEKSIYSEFNDMYYLNSGWYATKLFKLSDDFYNVLKFGKFKMVRIETTKGFIDMYVSDKKKDNIQKVLQCIY